MPNLPLESLFLLNSIISTQCGIGNVSNPDFNMISTCESGKVSRTARKNPVDIIRSSSQFGVQISNFEGIESKVPNNYSMIREFRS